jgi:uncharacterized surface protein with fasciclin (FAS1) repeats
MKNKFSKKAMSTIIFSSALLLSNLSFSQTVMVGGSAMYPTKNIIENAVNSKDHTTLVAAVKAAELVDVLQGDGPFTVFAPNNAAFDALPHGTVESLLKKENQNQLVGILTYHVLPGKYDFEKLSAEIKKSKGKVSIATVQGAKLTFESNGKYNIIVSDENGTMGNIIISDVYQSNGIIHSIDKVLTHK